MNLTPLIILKLVVLLCFASDTTAAGGQSLEPSVDELAAYAKEGARIFVYERYAKTGALSSRKIERLSDPVEILGATERRFGNTHIWLAGLRPCPTPTVIHNRIQHWRCEDAAADMMGMRYNERAKVVLCKTGLDRPTPGRSEPASCFTLTGGSSDLDSYMIGSDDKDMVFLGLADVEINADGSPARPDLMDTQARSRAIGFQIED